MMVVATIAVAAFATLVRVVTTADQPWPIPWVTLGLNSAGAFMLGFLLWFRPETPLVWTVAGLGSLTTFSTVAAEIGDLLDDGRRREAILYLGLTLVVGITAARLGLELGARL